MMNIGLLVCDHARKELDHPDGSYPEMFRKLLPGFQFTDYYVCDGKFPEYPDSCDGWVISGSRYSVYDEVVWIRRLKEFTRAVAVTGKPCIGVCFGHQVIGEALGGRVTKAASGWLVGAHSFEVTGEEPWMEPPLRQLTLLMMCQDQVVEVPEGTTVLARSASCPNGIIRVGPSMLGIQGHPEFTVGFERALIAVNSRYLAPGQAAAGEESLSQPVHSAEVGQWMARFFNEFRPV